MATNEFLPFAATTGANVETQTEFAGSAHQTNGFTTGTAFANQANKAWRQGTSCAAAWGILVNTVAGWDALDNGDIQSLSYGYQQVISAIASNATSQLLQRMANAEANINSLMGRMGTAESNITWCINNINSLLQRMGTAEGNINWLSQWNTNIQNWVDSWATPNINSLLSRMGNVEAVNGNQDNSINNLFQQTADLNWKINNQVPSMQGGGNGWCQFPNGLCFQWMQHSVGASQGGQIYTGFPRAFAGCWSIHIQLQWNGGGNFGAYPSATVINWDGNGVNWWWNRNADQGGFSVTALIFAIGNV